MVLDSLLRYPMAHRMLASTHLVAHAYDLAAVLCRLRLELTHLVCAAEMGAVSGFALKAPKCLPLPRWGINDQHMRTFLDEDIGFLAGCVWRESWWGLMFAIRCASFGTGRTSSSPAAA